MASAIYRGKKAGANKKGKKASWTARWRDGDKYPQQAGFATKQEAQDYGEEQEALVRQGMRTNPAEMKMTLHEFAIKHWAGGVRAKKQTKETYKRSLESHIFPKFGNTQMRSIKRLHIQTWMNEMESKGLAPKTIEKHANNLAAILKVAVQNDYLRKSPFDGWKRGKAEALNQVTPLDFDQVKTIALQMPERVRLIVWLGFHTGMRPSEMLGLTYDRIDFQKKEIVINRQLSRDSSQVFEDKGLKTKASIRTIALNETLEMLIKEHVQKFGLGPENLLFTSRTKGIWRYPDAARQFRVAGEGIVKPNQGLHQLRHTCVSTLINLGANITDIKEWVGHESITETVDTYGHWFKSRKSELGKLMHEHAVAQSLPRKLVVAN